MNPFSGYGAVVVGERLVGREREIGLLTERLAAGQGSFGIIGQPRIGKSSLAAEVVRRVREASPGRVCLCLDLSTTADSASFLRSLHEDLCDALEAIGVFLPEAHRPSPAADPYGQYRCLNRALKFLRNREVPGVVVVIDEFDHVRHFEDAALTIQRVRELVNNRHETGLSAVFVTRRSLRALEHQLTDVSTLDGVCEQHYLGPLERAELATMVARCQPDWMATEEDIEQLYRFTGGHPYLSEMVLCQAFDRRSLTEGLAMAVAGTFNHYEALRGVLQSDDSFSALLQICVGPRFDLAVGALERLQRYGLIRQDGQGFWRGWSEHFQSYLERCARETPLWDLWRETESALREFIREELLAALGDGWVDVLSQRHKPLKEMLTGCEERMARELKSFGTAGVSLLDYTYPMDLWAVIAAEWAVFRARMGRDKGYWNERFSLLSKVRTPTAHSRDQIIPKADLTLAQGYCQQILQVLQDGKS